MREQAGNAECLNYPMTPHTTPHPPSQNHQKKHVVSVFPLSQYYSKLKEHEKIYITLVLGVCVFGGRGGSSNLYNKAL